MFTIFYTGTPSIQMPVLRNKLELIHIKREEGFANSNDSVLVQKLRYRFGTSLSQFQMRPRPNEQQHDLLLLEVQFVY